MGAKEETPGRNAIRQRFEHGEIASSIDEDIVVSVFRLRNEACFEWSRPHFDHDYFRYDVTYNSVPQGQAAVQFRSEERGRVRTWVRLQGFGEYGFTVKSCTDPLLGSDGCRGFTVSVQLQLGEVAETPKPGGPSVSGLIGERWHELGAWAGPLGKPIADELLKNGIRSQQFENGSITTAPDFGPNMVVAAFQRHSWIEVHWGGANRPFNAFRVDTHLPGGGVVQEHIWLQGNTDWARTGIGSGQFTLKDPLSVGGTGTYFFFVFPAETSSLNPEPSLFPSDSTPTGEAPPPGATPAVRVKFREPNRIHQDPHAFDVRIEVPALEGTPAGAYASHGHRVNAIARHFAAAHPLVFPHRQEVAAGENETIQLIAHLQAASADPSFRTPGELPSRLLAHVFIRQLGRGQGQVGTSFDEGVLGTRKGDYDMALKGLMVALYRYRGLFTEEEVERTLIKLVPTEIGGPLRLSLHEYVFLTEDAPETENHILMIESTRYLVNQLLHDRIDDQRFDNSANGLASWLLGHLQQFAKHDFLEFNSRIYQRLSLHALLNLHEFARDERIRKAAQIILDYSMVKFAISSCRLRRVCPFRRKPENVNSTGDHNDLFLDPHADPLTAFFDCYTGPTDRDGNPTPWYPDVHTFNAVIGGLGSYRPPPAAYILAMKKLEEPEQHVFHHGQRPQLHEADVDAEGGLEIYSRSSSYLLTAGGMQLNSGYGGIFDYFADCRECSIPQSTTLMFSRAFDVKDRPELDLKFADLIRFDRWPLEAAPNNTAVHRGFACGANFEVPSKWLTLTGTTWEDGWLFLNLNKQLPDYGPLGLYVAAYRTGLESVQADHLQVIYGQAPPKNLGLLYAVESSTKDPDTGAPVTFAKFKNKVRESNDFPDPLRWADMYTFHTVDGHSYDFWLRPDSHKYSPRIFKEDGTVIYPNGFSGLPLVSGPYMTSIGHDGSIAFRYPGCDHAVIMDYSSSQFPGHSDNFASCPSPWGDRAKALSRFAKKLWAEKRHKEGNDALNESIAIYLRLIAVDPETYLPLLGEALINLLGANRADMDVDTARSIGRLAVTVYERLAGLRPADSQAPVDYEGLTAFTPNDYWHNPTSGKADLAEALYYLAHTQRETGDMPAG
ncbi:LGFP repeat-containing protein, partial [Streptomyces erythrochromogenes]|uniref:LGFP repeat-containing protein n=1 Tax=Streptomyces erythrochromogenes TaxID=285574 RepID=UPI003675ACA6